MRDPKTVLDSMFKPPEPTSRPLRVLVYGLPKHGKSHFVFTATEVGPLFWIDTEGGADFYDPAAGYGFSVLRSCDPDKITEAIRAASELARAVKGDAIPIVAIDSFSSIWAQQQEVAERLTEQWSRGRVKDRASFRAWGPAKKPLKRLYEEIHRAECHVIFTARGKLKYRQVGNEVEELGLGYDAERNLPYVIDIILEMNVEPQGKGVPPKPEQYIAVVVGSRSDVLPIGTVLRNPRFADLLPAVLSGERSPEAIESTVGEQIQRALSAPSTWAELRTMLPKLGWTEELARKVLREQFGEFDRSQVGEYYEFLRQNKPWEG